MEAAPYAAAGAVIAAADIVLTASPTASGCNKDVICSQPAPKASAQKAGIVGNSAILPNDTAVPITVNDGPKATSKAPVTSTGNNGTTKTTSKPKPKPVITEPGPSPVIDPHGNLKTPDADIASIQQQIAELAAAGIGGGNGGTGNPPASAASGGCQPGSSGSGVPDPFSFLLDQLLQGSIPLDQGNQQNQPLANAGQSFTPGTQILLPGGKTAPISSLKPGDKVTARDTKTGKDQTETVTAVQVHHDTDLYNLRVKTAHATQVIHTTSSHPFYDPYLHYGRIPANHLKPGMHLKTPDGQSAVVVGGSVPADHDGWMWDLTVPGNNDHDFYVTAGQSREVPVLVHNSDAECGPVYESPGHHDPSGGPDPYNPNKAVLPADAEAQFANSIEVDGVRWTKIGSGRSAVYYRYFDTGNDTWHFSGSSNGVTRSGANVGIPLNRIPIEIRRLP